MGIRLALSFSILTVILAACGPENKTMAQQEKEQIQKKVQESRQNLDPLVGTYEGKWAYSDTRETKTVRLTLFPFVQLISNPSRTEVLEVPTLAGSIQLESEDRDPKSAFPVGKFSVASFDSETKRVILAGTGDSGGTIFSLEGKFENNRIVGTYNSSLMRTVGVITIELEKVSDATAQSLKK